MGLNIAVYITLWRGPMWFKSAYVWDPVEPSTNVMCNIALSESGGWQASARVLAHRYLVGVQLPTTTPFYGVVF